jgi:hypothetical protein
MRTSQVESIKLNCALVFEPTALSGFEVDLNCDVPGMTNSKLPMQWNHEYHDVMIGNLNVWPWQINTKIKQFDKEYWKIYIQVKFFWVDASQPKAIMWMPVVIIGMTQWRTLEHHYGFTIILLPPLTSESSSFKLSTSYQYYVIWFVYYLVSIDNSLKVISISIARSGCGGGEQVPTCWLFIKPKFPTQTCWFLERVSKLELAGPQPIWVVYLLPGISGISWFPELHNFKFKLKINYNGEYHHTTSYRYYVCARSFFQNQKIWLTNYICSPNLYNQKIKLKIFW